MVFFFFKQKTASEMRISDWSSDVCSSDLDACASKLNDAAISRSKPASIASRAAAVRSARATVPYSGPTKIAARRVGAPGGVGGDAARDLALLHRSEARRVGKEVVRSCRYGWAPYH